MNFGIKHFESISDEYLIVLKPTKDNQKNEF
jgi:hypothetical protein